MARMVKGFDSMTKTFDSPTPSAQTTQTTPKMSSEEITALIRKKAYELWEKRGRTPGHSLDDWLEAERIVRGKK